MQLFTLNIDIIWLIFAKTYKDCLFQNQDTPWMKVVVAYTIQRIVPLFLFFIDYNHGRSFCAAKTKYYMGSIKQYIYTK